MQNTSSHSQERSSPGIGPQDHAAIGRAAQIPINQANPVLSISPISLPVKGRQLDLQIRVSAPAVGSNLPIILLSHGQGPSNNLSSLHGYGPLVHFWAAHGFVVIQPTHLSSKSLGLDVMNPENQFFWRSRVEDIRAIIDQLNGIESSFPALKGRLDSKRIAVAGHSMGGHTASMLLGATLIDPKDGSKVAIPDHRIKAGILLAAPGNGGAALSPWAFENLAFFRQVDFAEMTTASLVVIGDNDPSTHLTVAGCSWHADPYTHSTGPKSLLTLFGAGHGLGGISGYDVAETTDESPERVAALQRLTWAYLRSALYSGDNSWANACAALEEIKELGRVENK